MIIIMVCQVLRNYGKSKLIIAIAWLIHQEVVVIPKASDPKHIKDNRAAMDIILTSADITLLDQAFPPPVDRMPLAMR